jgi:hypothetical protein
MKFALDLPSDQSSVGQINYRNKVLFVGSCFADHLGQFFRQNHFHCLVNPNGILFNPHSVADSLNRIATCSLYDENDILIQSDRFFSWYHHGKFSSVKSNELLGEINHEKERAHDFIREAKWVIVTFGTAHAWFHRERRHVVANCHKVSGDCFEKKLLSADEISNQWKETIRQLRCLNSDLKFVLSVSPVRYIREGLIQNTRSKAELIRAVHSIGELEGVVYFPAYEIVTDVLRDYRFYGEDMVHPSTQAIEYVLSCFCTSFLDSESQYVIEQMKKLNKLRKHKVLHLEERLNHQDKLGNLEQELKRRFPALSWIS